MMSKCYHVITNVTCAMAKKYECKACNKAYASDITRIYDDTCSDCLTSTPCAFSNVLVSCDGCNGHFRCRACFDNRKQRTRKGNTVCECKLFCATCGVLMTSDTHVFNYRFCDI